MNLSRRQAAVLALASVTLLTRGARAAERRRLTNIVLEDQFRNRKETAQLRGDVVVLVYADRHGAEEAVAMGRTLHLRFHPSAEAVPATEWSRQPVAGLPGWPADLRVPDVHVIPVACIPDVPRAMQAVARSRLRKESQVVSVWLDFDDVMRGTFGMQPREPNVAVLDLRGELHAVLPGRLDELQFTELAADIDRLRLAARQDPRSARGDSLPVR